MLGNEIACVTVLSVYTSSIALQHSKPSLLASWQARESSSVVNPEALVFQIYEVIVMKITFPYLSHQLRSQEAARIEQIHEKATSPPHLCPLEKKTPAFVGSILPCQCCPAQGAKSFPPSQPALLCSPAFPYFQSLPL